MVKMGSFGDQHDDKIVGASKSNSNSVLDYIDAETELFDGIERVGDSEVEVNVLPNTAPFDDTVPLEDVKTLAVNLGGETQAVDNLDCGEDVCTQFFGDHDTEVVDDTDDEGTERTEVLGDIEEFLDVKSVKRVGTHPVDQENMLNNEKCNTGPRGSVHGGFTSCHVSSIRASSLAARNRDLKETNSGSCSIRDSSKYLEETDQRHSLEECDDRMKGSGSENKCWVSKSTVRKLFTEDTIIAEEGLDKNTCNSNKDAELPSLLTSENEFKGLSYADSEEPGEASQDNALDVVDSLLKVSLIEYDQEVEVKNSIGGKSKPISVAKRTQSLAKKANRICLFAEGGVYDWDDTQEDEGGGEFFRKKKETFFDDRCKRRKFSIQSQGSNSANPKSCRAVKRITNEEEQQEIRDKAAGLVYSDSKLLLHKPKVNNESKKVTGRNLRKNLLNELDEQFDTGSRDGKVEMGTGKDNLDMLNIGFDTQVFAEAMDYGSNGAKKDAETHQNVSGEGKYGTRLQSKKENLQERPCTSKSGVLTRKQSEQTEKAAPRLSRNSSISSPKRTVKVRNQCDAEIVQEEPKGPTSVVAREQFAINESVDVHKLRSGKVLIKYVDEIDRCHVTASGGRLAVKKQQVQEQFGPYANEPQSDFGEEMRQTGVVDPKRKRIRTELNASAKGKCTQIDSNRPSDLKNAKLTYNEQSDLELSRNSKTDAMSNCMDSGIKRKTRSSVVTCPVLPSRDRQSGKILSCRSLLARSLNDTSVNSNPIDQNVEAREVESSIGKSHAAIPSSDAETEEENSPLEAPRGDLSGCTTPVHCPIPVNEASPICMGDEYRKQSCRENLPNSSSLKKEISRLFDNERNPTYICKNSGKRKDLTKVQVLFSHYLDGDIINQQKKVLDQLGASVASSISDATHFVADKFVRTTNMLEAIAFGKPVVTPLWLESCGLASCLIDERNYILRDSKKEKEFGFNLPVSLARASLHPLLQGQKVLITQNTKPGKEILASLVKAVHGVVIERIGRYALKDDKFLGSLLILSCKEDYDDSVPFLEKGAQVYSSELLLNGMVTQKLDYERHRLFLDDVRRTRSTIWLRKKGDQYIPVIKCKS